MIPSNFECPCAAKKKYKLVFDGGVLGYYSLELCKSCYVIQNKKFLINEVGI